MDFIKWKFKYSPFSWNNLKIGLLGIVIFGIVNQIPFFDLIILDLLVRSTLIVILYAGGIFIFKMNPELISITRGIIVKYINKK